MIEKLTLIELPPSPNNIKVRIGLNYKGLSYKSQPIELNNERSEVIEISTQPLTPVLKHGDIVIFDSASILRYLDSNFPQTPCLFSSDFHTMREMERWEFFARTDLVEPIGMIFGQYFSTEKDIEVINRANKLINERTACIEDELDSKDWLLGNQMTVVDVTAGAVLFYGDVHKSFYEKFPIAKFFKENLSLGEGREKTKKWIKRVMAYDKYFQLT